MIIGIIDSGAGGKFFEDQILETFGKKNVTTIRYSPLFFETYSNSSVERLCSLSEVHLDYIFSKCSKPDFIVVACMTLSSNCLQFITKLIKAKNKEIQVLDMLTCLPYITNNTTIFATPNTIKSNRFSYCIEVPCANLSFDIEKRISKTKIEASLKEYADKFNIICTPIILLGCSHYSIIKREFQNVFNPEQIIDPLDIILQKLKELSN
jgi:glutamate racemase